MTLKYDLLITVIGLIRVQLGLQELISSFMFTLYFHGKKTNLKDNKQITSQNSKSGKITTFIK